MAETTTATRFPASFASTTRRATFRMRSGSPTLVPPYFWTIRAIDSFRSGGRRSEPAGVRQAAVSHQRASTAAETGPELSA